MINVTADFTTETERDYPYIGYSRHKNQLVLFTSERCGVLIDGRSSAHRIGEYVTGWYEHKFTPVKGTITISNK